MHWLFVNTPRRDVALQLLHAFLVAAGGSATTFSYRIRRSDAGAPALLFVPGFAANPGNHLLRNSDSLQERFRTEAIIPWHGHLHRSKMRRVRHVEVANQQS